MKKWYPVKVTIGDDSFEDEIWAESPSEALLNAWYNWEHANYIRLSKKVDMDD